MASTSIPDRATFIRRGLRLEYLTLGWNSLEALVAVIAGVMAGSIALMGFGIDSVIESVSGAVLIWRLRTDADVRRREHVERIARRLVGMSFFLLTAYVAAEAISTLLQREVPERSVPGIAVAIAALIVMPLLARLTRRLRSPAELKSI